MFASKDLFFSKPSGGYQISRSVRTRSSATAYFNRTFSTPTLGTKWTWSAWVKRGTLSSAQTLFSGQVDVNNWGIIAFLAGDTLSFQQADAGSVTSTVTTTQVFRDPSAWYHIVVVFDSTQATAANRLLMYVNGVQVTAFGTATYLAQNTASRINAAVAHQISRYISAAQYFDGYMTEVNFIDGQALTPSSFGSTNTTTGVWQPKAYSGTYGTNGFYLNFSDNSAATATTIGKDYSGNGNNWTPNNISVTAGVTYDSMLDSPTPYADGGNGRGNYCVLNPLDFNSGTVSNGNLQWVTSSAVGNGCFGTFAFDIADSTNKYYWEMTLTSGDVVFGIVPLTTLPSNTSRTGSYSYYTSGSKYSGTSASAYGASFTSGDVIGVTVGAGIITFYKNGTSQGSAFTGLTGFFKPAIWEVSGTFNANFGQRPFTYTPPTGFVALNTQNLSTPTISNGAAYMAATTYTGTGASLTIANTVGSTSFQPDFVWVKGRSGATDHALYDSVRGTTKDLVSNSTAAETTQTTGLTAFGSTGFTVGALAKMNTNAATYVGWQWKESASAGFDIVACTTNSSGILTATSHNLGVVPAMVILKARAGVDAWYVYHQNSTTTPTQGTLQLNSTSAVNTTNGSSGGVDKWTLTSTTFAAGNAAWTYLASTTQIAYLFSAVAGYSAFGSYTGNGSTDGPFVFCGFRPRFIMIKRTDTTASWYVYDTSRNTYNTMNNWLAPNLSDAENTATTWEFDFLSNGFKVRNNGAFSNASGGTYIFMAVAENPFKLSLAR